MVFVIGLFGEPVERKEERTRDSYALNGIETRRRRSEFRVDSHWDEDENRGKRREIDVELELNK